MDSHGMDTEFVGDLVRPRDDGRALHIIQAIGSSSAEKGLGFVAKNIPRDREPTRPNIYDTYNGVYNDPQVDIVYIGTPHAFHKQNCLDAIAAGKHVMCEKAFTVNAREAREVLDAAKKRGCLIMEAMWLRFRPLVSALREKLFEEGLIGEVRRMYCEFGMDMNFKSLAPKSRLKDPALGAGSLLDLGVYCITWALLTLQDKPSTQIPVIHSVQTLQEGVDTTTSILLQFPESGRHAMLRSTMELQSPEKFCVIEGTEGVIEICGFASVPTHFYVYPKNALSPQETIVKDPTSNIPAAGIVCNFSTQGEGFYYEADAVALDIAAGRTESDIMAQAESLRVMEIMDEIRRQGGARFPQDDYR